MIEDSNSEAFFERKYLQDEDPWDFTSSIYEQSRYDAIVGALEHVRYRRALEPGCSIGMLTRRLASLCDKVEASEISGTAAARARENCRDLPNVNIIHGALPGAIPDGPFDLVVLSEIGYYFHDRQLFALGAALVDRLESTGTLLAAHWLGHSGDHVLSGDRVHTILSGLQGISHVHAERHTGFRLDRWEKR